MAVCEIWDVRGRLDHPIDYAENPEKTANPKYTEADLQAMVDVMEYATNKDMLDNRYALLFIRGERPVMDFKYDIMKHPNVKLTADGGQPPYIHGEPTQAVATLVFDSDIPQSAVSVNAVSTSYELLSDEDLEEIFNI